MIILTRFALIDAYAVWADAVRCILRLDHQTTTGDDDDKFTVPFDFEEVSLFICLSIAMIMIRTSSAQFLDYDLRSINEHVRLSLVNIPLTQRGADDPFKFKQDWALLASCFRYIYLTAGTGNVAT